MIKRFEDLLAWQKSRIWASRVYAETSKGAFARDFELKDQIRRASISVMSNLAEGFERKHRTEFVQVVNIARGSCAEAKSQLYLALDVGHLDQTTFGSLMADADEICRILGGLRRSLEQPPSTPPNDGVQN